MFNIQSAFTYRTVPDYAEESVELSLQNDNWYRNAASQPGCWVKPFPIKPTFYVCDHADIVQSRLSAEVKRWIEEHVDDAINTSIDNDNSSSVALCCEEYVEDTEKLYNEQNEAKQSSCFVGTSTLPPRRKYHSNSKRPRSPSPGEETSDNKRKRVQFSDTELDAFFFLSMENKLKENIRTVVRKNNKKMNEQLAALKQKLSTAKKLPRGIITGAAKLAEFTCNEPNQADLVLQQMRSFTNNRVETILAKSAQPESNDTDRNSVSDTDCPSRSPDPSIKDLIMKKLQRAMIGSTDYILHFSSLIQMMMICLKTNQFFLDGDVINTRKVNGFDITTIVPSEFHTDSPKYTITPLAMDVSDSPAFDADFSQLFQEQHFSLISTKYFGNRGSQGQTLNAHPIQTALFKLMDAEDIKKETFPVENVPSSLMSLALQIYMTNFKNMWADKTMINNLLDKMLVILLRLHLAPKRELQRRQNILNYISLKPEEKRPSKNYGRYILRAEKKKLARYKEKVREAEADSYLLLKRIRAVKMAETRIRSL
ncbi:hypothetical protein G6F54_000908 [Rhizopus delemar]|nr:hypothetical protein G6F54_000908 [Rhizopus delemar]